MTRLVLDASVALAWFLDRPIPPLAVRTRQELLGGGRAIVPSLWHLEVANSFAMAERRGLLETADIGPYLDGLEQLLIQAIDTSTATVPLRQVYSTARAFQLSAYDAAYLELAREEQIALATLDQDLRQAATRAGIELFR